ncbi:MAG: flavodoxin [Breznakibacter sp.]
MGKIGVFYGSTVGNTRFVAEKIAKLLPEAEVRSVKELDGTDIASYSVMVIGTSTWGIGSFQDDFFQFVARLSNVDLSGITVALFGLGDQFNYPDSFCDGMGLVYEILSGKGCKIVGEWPAGDYNFSESRALKNGTMVGLALDEDNEPDLTDYRIKTWVKSIKAELTQP